MRWPHIGQNLFLSSNVHFFSCFCLGPNSMSGFCPFMLTWRKPTDLSRIFNAL
uniref:Uncharacterized protein n=1 Tax=Rhizophora mucronata TaxID=61149 RepID=A0A2P2LQZ3_RHIMU